MWTYYATNRQTLLPQFSFPRSYNFTVNVTKRGQSSQAMAQVTFVESTLPTIKINPFTGLINPANKLTIKGKRLTESLKFLSAVKMPNTLSFLTLNGL